MTAGKFGWLGAACAAVVFAAAGPAYSVETGPVAASRSNSAPPAVSARGDSSASAADAQEMEEAALEGFDEGVEPAPTQPVIQLEWSGNPGAYEESLQRRNLNPLFVEARQQIGKQELVAAKQVDAARMWANLESFIDLLLDKRRMSRLETASEMGDALLQIDEGTWTALRIGGESYALAAEIQALRTWLLKEWRVSSERDPGVKALLAAEGRIRPVRTDSRAIRFMALIQMGGGDDSGPIPVDEFGAALMSEDAETISKVLKALRGQLRKMTRQQIVELLEFVRHEKIELDGLAEKFEIAGAALGLKNVELDF